MSKLKTLLVIAILGASTYLWTSFFLDLQHKKATVEDPVKNWMTRDKLVWDLYLRSKICTWYNDKNQEIAEADKEVDKAYILADVFLKHREAFGSRNTGVSTPSTGSRNTGVSTPSTGSRNTGVSTSVGIDLTK